MYMLPLIHCDIYVNTYNDVKKNIVKEPTGGPCPRAPLSMTSGAMYWKVPVT